jgi:ribonuclease BN (tRNA processing enzyme)
MIAGPPGLRERLTMAMENFFPGSSQIERRFSVDVQELDPGRSHDIAGIEVTPFVVRHASGAPPFALRLKVDDKVICYSGDTEWVDSLQQAASKADLFIAEAYSFDRPIKFHLDYMTLARHLPEIGPKRVILTHMSADMLTRASDTGCDIADDGLIVTI